VGGRGLGDGAADALVAVLASAYESGSVRWDLNPSDLFMPVISRRQADADLWSLRAVLAAACTAGNGHRDLKPANVLISGGAGQGTASRLAGEVAGLQGARDQIAIGAWAPGEERISIIDFGVAHTATSSVGQADEGSPWPRFAAPEVDPPPAPVDFSVLAARALARTDGDAAADAILAQTRGNPFSLFAAWGSGPPQAVITLKVQVRLLVEDVRDGLLRFIDAILAAFSLVLVLLLAALAHRPAVTAFTLLLIAVARCFGRRGETDDLQLPAHQSLPVAGGPPGRQ
jgi:hypothetical protein